MTKDYYSILGVDRNATQADIKKAYRKAAMEWHPDKWVDATDDEKHKAEDRFKEINEAYAVLSDEEKKHNYDTYGTADANMEDMFGGWGDIFSHFMGGFNGRGGQVKERGKDIRTTIDLTIDEIYNGTKKTIKVKTDCTCHKCHGSGSEDNETTTCNTCNGTGRVRTTTRFGAGVSVTESACPTCHGSGTVITNPCSECGGTGLEHAEVDMDLSIPAGVDNGSVSVLRGRGGAGPHRGIPGDLYIVINELPNDKGFTRDRENNLYYTCRAPYKDFVFGGDVTVPLINGSQKIHMDCGTQSGKVFKLYGKGFPSPDGGKRGNFYVTMECDIPDPSKLSKEDKKKIKDL